ncbi:MAG: hydroxysqualene dehydroxylase HpnE [Verrucomicrobiota bacterium]
MQDLPDSQTITQKSGSNLALSFFILPKEKREAMAILYAFCRTADDIVDEKDKSLTQKLKEIEFWNQEIDACYTGTPQSRLGQDLAKIVRLYLIPPDPLKDIMRGVEMDLHKSRYPSFAELETYCYRVASAVGLASIEIFEHSHAHTKAYAVALGMAFQLTNILRDIQYDLLEYDRIYIPQDELDTFQVTEDDLRTWPNKANLKRLCLLQYHRAKHFYAKAARLLPAKDSKNMAAAEIMTHVYSRLLEKLRKNNFGLGKAPVQLNKFEKVLAVIKAMRSFNSLPTSTKLPQRVAIFGGGFAGIATAVHLSRGGHQVEIFEAKSYTGGRAHSYNDTKTGITFDNGQHILMGCYHSCLNLIKSLGVEEKLEIQKSIHVPYHSLDKGITHLRAANLPAPFHLLKALLSFEELSWKDRIAICYFGLSLRIGQSPSQKSTVKEWLLGQRQTPHAIHVLWEPLCIAALNEPIASASAKLFEAVLRQSLFGGTSDASIYFSKVGLSELLMPEAELFLKATGGRIHTGEPIKELCFEKDKLISFKTTRQTYEHFDQCISCMPSKALSSLLPETSPLKNQIAQIPSSPIISVHILCDTPIINQPFVGLLDSPVQWIFDRTDYLPSFANDFYHYTIIISAAYQELELKRPELLELIKKEIQQHFPQSKKMTISRDVIYKSIDATFAATPSVDEMRPQQNTEWSNFHLAGDWVQTYLPATLEGAVLSAGPVTKLIDRDYSSTIPANTKKGIPGESLISR